jgi:hypothetical protein
MDEPGVGVDLGVQEVVAAQCAAVPFAAPGARIAQELVIANGAVKCQFRSKSEQVIPVEK